jgi:hypothetical protein
MCAAKLDFGEGVPSAIESRAAASPVGPASIMSRRWSIESPEKMKGTSMRLRGCATLVVTTMALRGFQVGVRLLWRHPTRGSKMMLGVWAVTP